MSQSPQDAAVGAPEPVPATRPAAGPPPPGSARNASLVAAGILLSRVAGLVREKALAYFLGVGFAADAYRAALKIPNLIQNLLGEGVLSASFIPVYARLLDEDRREEAGRVAGAVAGLLAAVAGALVVLGVVAARPITALVAFGFEGEKLALTVTLVRILFPGVGLLALSAWCLGILNSHRRFFLAYVAPVLWNAAIIAAAVAAGLAGLGNVDTAVAIAWGTLAGGALQLAVQVPGVRRLEPRLRPSLRIDLAATREVLRAFGPVVAARGSVQLVGYVDLLLASLLATGAVSALGLAQVFYLLPISLFGMSVAAAELPELSSSRDATDEVRARVEQGARRVAFFVVPTVCVYVLAGDLVVGVFAGGEFGPVEVVQVWAVLGALSIGLLASTQGRLLQSALYGMGDASTPSRITVVRVSLAALLGLALMFPLDRVGALLDGLELVGPLASFTPVSEALRTQRESAVRLGAAGLGLAAGAAAWVEYRLLRRAVQRRVGRLAIGGRTLLPLAAAGLVCGLVARAGAELTDALPPPLAALVVLPVAGAVYLGMATALGVEGAAQLRRVLRRR